MSLEKFNFFNKKGDLIGYAKCQVLNSSMAVIEEASFGKRGSNTCIIDFNYFKVCNYITNFNKDTLKEKMIEIATAYNNDNPERLHLRFADDLI